MHGLALLPTCVPPCVATSSLDFAAGPTLAACVVDTNEHRVLSESSHHECHHRGHQPADTKRDTGEAQLCGPGWL